MTVKKAYNIVFIMSIYIIVVSLIIFLSTGMNFNKYVKGFLLGGLVSLINFNNIIKSSRNFLGENPKLNFKSNIFIRMLLYVLVLGVAILLPDRFNIYLTFLGVLTSKIVIIPYILIKRGDVFDNE